MTAKQKNRAKPSRHKAWCGAVATAGDANAPPAIEARAELLPHVLLMQLIETDPAALPPVWRLALSRIREYVKCGGGQTLDQVFGFSGGSRSAAHQVAKMRRDAAFVAAYRCVQPQERSDWACCERIADALERFREEQLSAWQASGAPAAATEFERALYAICDARKARPAIGTYGVFALLKKAGVLG